MYGIGSYRKGQLLVYRLCCHIHVIMEIFYEHLEPFKYYKLYFVKLSSLPSLSKLLSH